MGVVCCSTPELTTGGLSQQNSKEKTHWQQSAPAVMRQNPVLA